MAIVFSLSWEIMNNFHYFFIVHFRVSKMIFNMHALMLSGKVYFLGSLSIWKKSEPGEHQSEQKYKW